VISLYYYEELTLREIGEVLGVTESRVSQLHTKAVLRLRRCSGDGATTTVRCRRSSGTGRRARRRRRWGRRGRSLRKTIRGGGARRRPADVLADWRAQTRGGTPRRPADQE
jgi:hypothetical protein